MRRYLIFISIAACLSCKTTKNNSSNLLAWANDAEKQEAKATFTKVIEECVPIISEKIERFQTVRPEQVSDFKKITSVFLDRLLVNPTNVNEEAYTLLKDFKSEKALDLDTCEGKSADSVLVLFAIQTNIIEIAYGKSSTLKMLATN